MGLPCVSRTPTLLNSKTAASAGACTKRTFRKRSFVERAGSHIPRKATTTSAPCACGSTLSKQRRKAISPDHEAITIENVKPVSRSTLFIPHELSFRLDREEHQPLRPKPN